MQEHFNVDIFRRLYDSFTTGDMVKVAEEFADDLVWHVPGRNSISGDYKAPDEALGCFRKDGRVNPQEHTSPAPRHSGQRRACSGASPRDGSSQRQNA